MRPQAGTSLQPTAGSTLPISVVLLDHCKARCALDGRAVLAVSILCSLAGRHLRRLTRQGPGLPEMWRDQGAQ